MGSIPVGSTGERAMKKKFEKIYFEDKKDERVINVDKKTKLKIEYEFKPNEVGPRNSQTGLLIWVGKTIAKASLNGGTEKEVEAKCWIRDPYSMEIGREVVTGILLKELELPTKLAEQVKAE